MKKRNPEIERIWKEYLKRRDSNETDKKQEVNDSKQEQEER